MPAASSHERIDAGPATFAALSAPRSHPDPIIEPNEMNISPLNPTIVLVRLTFPRLRLPFLASSPGACSDHLFHSSSRTVSAYNSRCRKPCPPFAN